MTIDPSFFLQYLKEPRCVGFGEIGLDYTTTYRCSSHHGKNEKKDCMKRKIRKQVKFLEHMLPLIPEDVVIVVHTNSTLSEKGDQECLGHDFLMSQSAVCYVSSKARLRNYCLFIF